MFASKIAAFVVVASLLVGGSSMASWEYRFSTTLSLVGTHSGGQAIYYLTPAEFNGIECKFGHIYWNATDTSKDSKAMFSLAMAAYLSGKMVQIAFDRGDDDMCVLGLIAAL